VTSEMTFEKRIEEAAKECKLRYRITDGDIYHDWRIELEAWPAMFFVYPNENGFLIAARKREFQPMDWSGKDGKIVTLIGEVIQHIYDFENEIR